MEAGAPRQRQLWGEEEEFSFVTYNKGRLITFMYREANSSQ